MHLHKALLVIRSNIAGWWHHAFGLSDTLSTANGLLYLGAFSIVCAVTVVWLPPRKAASLNASTYSLRVVWPRGHLHSLRPFRGGPREMPECPADVCFRSLGPVTNYVHAACCHPLGRKCIMTAYWLSRSDVSVANGLLIRTRGGESLFRFLVPMLHKPQYGRRCGRHVHRDWQAPHHGVERDWRI